MKSLLFEEMVAIEGGSLSTLIGGICAGVFIVDIFAPWLSLTPVGGQILVISNVGCGVYAIYKGLS